MRRLDSPSKAFSYLGEGCVTSRLSQGETIRLKVLSQKFNSLGNGPFIHTCPVVLRKGQCFIGFIQAGQRVSTATKYIGLEPSCLANVNPAFGWQCRFLTSAFCHKCVPCCGSEELSKARIPQVSAPRGLHQSTTNAVYCSEPTHLGTRPNVLRGNLLHLQCIFRSRIPFASACPMNANSSSPFPVFKGNGMSKGDKPLLPWRNFCGAWRIANVLDDVMCICERKSAFPLFVQKSTLRSKGAGHNRMTDHSVTISRSGPSQSRDLATCKPDTGLIYSKPIPQ